MADVRPTKLQNDGNGYGSLREFADGDTVPIAQGGTGAATAAGARTSLGLGSAAVRTALGSTGSLYSRDSILGVVSQASGVPTGAIIERGSNSNGEFIRLADGTAFCWGAGTGLTDTGTLTNQYGTTSGTVYYSNIIVPLPLAFVGLQRAFATPTVRGLVGPVSRSGTTQIAVQIRAVATGTEVPFDWFAAGRWF